MKKPENKKTKDKRQKTKDKRQKTKRNKRNKKFTGGVGYCGNDPMDKEEFQSVLVKLNLDKDDLQLTKFILNIKDQKLKKFLIDLTSKHYGDEIYTENKNCTSLRLLLTNFSETLKQNLIMQTIPSFLKKKKQFDEEAFINYLTDKYEPYNEYIKKERDQMIQMIAERKR